LTLQKLPKLHRLQLFHTPITDAGAQTLSQFPALCELDVADTLITNNGVAHLARLSGLTWLRLDQCSAGQGRELRINDAGLEYVARMPSLREVGLIQLNVSDSGLQKLKQSCPVLTVRR
jgi:internalin A